MGLDPKSGPVLLLLGGFRVLGSGLGGGAEGVGGGGLGFWGLRVLGC